MQVGGEPVHLVETRRSPDGNPGPDPGQFSVFLPDQFHPAPGEALSRCRAAAFRDLPDHVRRDPLEDDAERPPFTGLLAGGARIMSFRLVCHSCTALSPETG